MSYRIAIPVCEVCAKRLTPEQTALYREYAGKRASEYCCGTYGKGLDHYDSPSTMLYDTFLRWNPSQGVTHVTMNVRAAYALERVVASSWVGLALFGGYTNQQLAERGPLLFNITNNDAYQIGYTTKSGKNVLVTGKLVRMIKTLLAPEVIEQLLDEDFELFHNLFVASTTSALFNWKLVKGEAIREWYLDRVYASGCGILSTSCMRHASCQSYFDIYVKNPDQVSLLVAVSRTDLKLHGRALVWTMADGKIYLDRPYGNDVMQQQFCNYAIEQGWQYYGKNVPSSFISLDKADFTEYPYLDTFSFINVTNATLNHDGHAGVNDIELCSTMGELGDGDTYDYYDDDND